MPVTGNILALDLGVNCGFAVGRPGDVPTSGSVRLKKASEPRDAATFNLRGFLIKQITENRPSLIVKEAMLHVGAFQSLKISQDVILAHAEYHGEVKTTCYAYGIPWEDAPNATVRKHFIGIGRTSDRASTKAAVISRAKLLGYMPKDSFDEDRADALAIFDWSCAVFGQRTPPPLHLFGETTL